MVVITKAGETQEFAYTGGMQEFEVTIAGLYKLEVWGCAGEAGYAKGGRNEYRPAGGSGGYSKGYIQLKKGDILYVCCGGILYNGGGNGSSRTKSSSGEDYSCNGGCGGGATHVSKTNTILANTSDDDLIIVAGGGGGGSACQNGYRYPGGSGGGMQGGNGTGAVGGTQTSGHAKGSGQTGQNGAGGGGGGYWGGRSGNNAYDQALSGGGGSGYIGGVPAITYKGQEYEPDTQNGVQSGNGKAAITLMQKTGSNISIGTIDIIGISVGDVEVDLKVG